MKWERFSFSVVLFLPVLLFHELFVILASDFSWIQNCFPLLLVLFFFTFTLRSPSKVTSINYALVSCKIQATAITKVVNYCVVSWPIIRQPLLVLSNCSVCECIDCTFVYFLFLLFLFRFHFFSVPFFIILCNSALVFRVHFTLPHTIEYSRHIQCTHYNIFHTWKVEQRYNLHTDNFLE